MTNQAQKRPFASLMEQDYDSGLNDKLSPERSLSPMALDDYTENNFYMQQHNIMYNQTDNSMDHSNNDNINSNNNNNNNDNNNNDNNNNNNIQQHYEHLLEPTYHQQQQQQQQHYLSHQLSPPPSQSTSIITNTQQQPVERQRQRLTKQEQAYCIKTLTALMKHRKAIAFLQPVDVVAFNIPDYFDIVKQPMDLGTISKNLSSHQYGTVDAFLADVQLVFDNCFLYNNAQDPVSLDAKKLEEVFIKWLKKRPQPQPETIQPVNVITDATASQSQPQPQPQPQQHEHNHHDQQQGQHTSASTVAVETGEDNSVENIAIMPDEQFKLCESAVRELKKGKHADINWPFLLPVNAEAWGATDYYQIIQHPMDLATVERKLGEYEYVNEDQFEKDIRLIFTNCYAYNPPEHAVHQLGKKLEHVFDSFWKKIHKKASSKAKKESKKLDKKFKLESHAKPTQLPLPIALSPSQTSQLSPPSSSSPLLSTIAQPEAVPIPSQQSVKIQQSNVQKVLTTKKDEHLDRSTANTEEARPPTILRLKLTTKPPKDESKSNTPTPPRTTTNTSQEPKPTKVPGLALSTEPRNDSNKRPKLAIGHKTSPPPDKPILEKKKPLVLQNHDKWLALAQKSASTDDMDSSILTPPPSSTNVTTSSLASTTATTPAAPKTKEATVTPGKAFDITEFIDRMKCENRVWDQQKREEEEQRKENDRLYMEKKHQSLRQQKELIKEHKEWMEQRKRKDKAARLASLGNFHIDISKQKMIFHQFESSSLNRDQDWRDLFIWQRDTVDYRRIPAPGFVRRANLGLKELQGQILTKGIRLRPQHDSDSKADVDMDIE